MIIAPLIEIFVPRTGVVPGFAPSVEPALAQGDALAARLEKLVIVTATGKHEFRVEIARTPQQRQLGLMFRQSMAADRGMLFDYHAEVPVSMWMKNTYLSLDMVFILGDGKVLQVEHETTPLSEKLITSGGPVRAVLELNAGAARRIGLQPGDQIIHPAFKSAK